ncbi:hypothetical protein [Sphingobium yanoikuyae]|uniref:Uncharacterized protein n=1 Tax=Sphingobium yanoikuyae TaxID=13690 RepID=A0A3G2UN73_SPHYA|nr:hypothetical protein [Sphingobium yanoikuyae]AYO76403.1 hypothetical protein EBF16_05275 [Sphingobium yanoikuyae]
MGWKAVRDHYRIEHFVQVTDAGICIGSPYIHDIIVVSVDRGEIVRRWDGIRSNSDLERYLEEMDADPVKLAELVAADDVFERSIPVYTYEGGDIIEKQCEALGYPNVTHDGCMQYENTFSPDAELVRTWAIANAQAGIEWMREALEQTEKTRAEQSHRLAQREHDLRRLTERDRKPST